MLRCVNCDLKHFNEQGKLVCEIPNGETLDLTSLLIVSPQIMCTVKCQQKDINHVIDELYRKA